MCEHNFRPRWIMPLSIDTVRLISPELALRTVQSFDHFFDIKGTIT